MPRGEQKLTTIYLRDLDEQESFIRYMLEKKKVTPLMLGRALFAAAAEYYNVHGKFEFPVRIEPEAFQRQWLAAEGKQAGYEPSPTAIIEAEEAARRYELAQKKAARMRRGAAPRRPATGGG